MKKLCLALLTIILIPGCSPKEQPKKVDLNGIFSQFANDNYALNPLLATQNNVHDFNDQLAIDISEEYQQKAIALNTRYLDILNTVIYDSLTESEKLSVDFCVLGFQERLKEKLDRPTHSRMASST